KKYITLILTLALVLSLFVPAFAEGAVGSGDMVEVGFTFEVNEPKYTVEIPAVIELELGETVNLPVTATIYNPELLVGRKIVFTLEDAVVGDIKSFFPDGVEPAEIHAWNDFLVVKNDFAPSGYYKTLCYMVSGEILNYDALHGYESPAANWYMHGWKFFEFTESDTKNLGFWCPGPTNGFHDSEGNVVWFNVSKVYPNSQYSGWVTFGIRLEW
ncbi:MAG: hypothetical protein FWG43_04615, partial [Clostridiales bacterium]|nr:hypothetical protein [Clostridiales bacterium]